MPKQKYKPSLRILFLQLLISGLILMFFSTYLWAVQLKYDHNAVGYERALMYTLIVFGAGFSYDCAKRILFLPQPQFIRFGKHLTEATLHLCFTFLLWLASGTFFYLNHPIGGQLVFLLVVGWMLFFIRSSSLALETASADEV